MALPRPRVSSNRFARLRWCRALAHWLRENIPALRRSTVEGLWQFFTARRCAPPRWRQHSVYHLSPRHVGPWFQRALPAQAWKKVLYWKLAANRVLRDARAVAFTLRKKCASRKTPFNLARGGSGGFPPRVALPAAIPRSRAKMAAPISRPSSGKRAPALPRPRGSQKRRAVFDFSRLPPRIFPPPPAPPGGRAPLVIAGRKAPRLRRPMPHAGAKFSAWR